MSICRGSERDLYPCHQFVGRSGYKQGTVTTGIVRTDLVQEFRRTTLLTKDQCRSCFARYFCGGGCHANAELFPAGFTSRTNWAANWSENGWNVPCIYTWPAAGFPAQRTE